jgi:hypothetical protein
MSVISEVASTVELPNDVSEESWMAKVTEFKGAIENGIYDNELVARALPLADKKLDVETATEWLTEKLDLLASGKSAGPAESC